MPCSLSFVISLIETIHSPVLGLLTVSRRNVALAFSSTTARRATALGWPATGWTRESLSKTGRSTCSRPRAAASFGLGPTTQRQESSPTSTKAARAPPTLRRLYKKWPYFTNGTAKSLDDVLTRVRLAPGKKEDDLASFSHARVGMTKSAAEVLSDSAKTDLLAFLNLL